jgi:hypothetical protein
MINGHDRGEMKLEALGWPEYRGTVAVSDLNGCAGLAWTALMRFASRSVLGKRSKLSVLAQRSVSGRARKCQ